MDRGRFQGVALRVGSLIHKSDQKRPLKVKDCRRVVVQ